MKPEEHAEMCISAAMVDIHCDDSLDGAAYGRYENCKFWVIRSQPSWMWSALKVNHFQFLGGMQRVSAINFAKIHKLALTYFAYQIDFTDTQREPNM